MSYRHQEVCLKPDSAIYQDDQEDILMSYLNTDYMSSSVGSTWSTMNNQQVAPPTPNSTPTYGQSPVSTPDDHQNYYDMVASSDSWSQQPSTPTTEDYTQPLINEFSLMISGHYQEPIVPYTNNQLMYNHLQQEQSQPISPPGSSNSVCSSDSERSKKKRGRKKRDSGSNTSSSRLHNANIAPAAPTVKHLATILPAKKLNSQSSPSISIGSFNFEDKYTRISTPVITREKIIPEPASISRTNISTTDATVDSQKAATIAKRQERLIKNRAAALLSRKRKREHLTALEEQRNDLVSENDSLKERVIELEKANMELKKKMDVQQNNDSKSVMMFMVSL